MTEVEGIGVTGFQEQIDKKMVEIRRAGRERTE